MFSLTFVNAQQCNGNKIRVYKCVGPPLGNNCVSKCVSPNQIPTGWSIYPCDCGRSRLANEQADRGLFTLAISPNSVLSSSIIHFFLKQSQKVSLKIIDVNGRLVSTLDNKNLQFQSTENFLTEKLIATK